MSWAGSSKGSAGQMRCAWHQPLSHAGGGPGEAKPFVPVAWVQGGWLPPWSPSGSSLAAAASLVPRGGRTHCRPSDLWLASSQASTQNPAPRHFWALHLGSRMWPGHRTGTEGFPGTWDCSAPAETIPGKQGQLVSYEQGTWDSC